MGQEGSPNKIQQHFPISGGLTQHPKEVIANDRIAEIQVGKAAKKHGSRFVSPKTVMSLWTIVLTIVDWGYVELQYSCLRSGITFLG